MDETNPTEPESESSPSITEGAMTAEKIAAGALPTSDTQRLKHAREINEQINRIAGDKELLSPHEAAQLFSVSPKTITRWAKDGKITHIVTMGGHRRYRRTDMIDTMLKSINVA